MKQVCIVPLSKPVNAIVSIPGSKSITNRALVMATMCTHSVILKNVLLSDDTLTMISCLKSLGIHIDISQNKIVVDGNIKDIKNKTYILDAKLSGTTMRFLLALSCIIPGEKILTGELALCKRPIKDLVDALIKLGAKIEYLKQEGFPPVRVQQPVIPNQVKNLPKEVTINASTSSQFISALLIILPHVKDINLKLEGKPVSKSYIELTKKIMKEFGVGIIEKNKTFKTKGNYSIKEFSVEGDFSAASYFAAIAALTKSTITLQNLNSKSVQGDKEFFKILEEMGNKIIYSSNNVRVIGTGIKPVIVNMGNCPDQIQTLAVLAAFAKGVTRISGIETLKVKETDRLSAMITELKKMGIKTEIINSTLVIHGGNPHGATIGTYGDHRMAMAFAIAGTKIPEVIINNPDVVSKTFPDFWKELRNIGINYSSREEQSNDSRSIINDSSHMRSNSKKQNIVLIGFMGAGKSSVAPLLARKLKQNVIEMDELVVKKSKRKSIKEIFETDGEDMFRNLEYKIAKSLSNKSGLIISTGGGVVMNNKTIQELKKNATVVFLSTAFETIEKRLINTTDRPLWKDKTQTRKLFELRKPLYESSADASVITDGKSLGMIMDEIVKKVEELQ